MKRRHIRLQEGRKLRNDQTRKRRDQLPFVVLTRDIEEPPDTSNDRIRAYHLNLARRTERDRNKKHLEGDWSCTSGCNISTSDWRF